MAIGKQGTTQSALCCLLSLSHSVFPLSCFVFVIVMFIIKCHFFLHLPSLPSFSPLQPLLPLFVCVYYFILKEEAAHLIQTTTTTTTITIPISTPACVCPLSVCVCVCVFAHDSSTQLQQELCAFY